MALHWMMMKRQSVSEAIIIGKIIMKEILKIPKRQTNLLAKDYLNQTEARQYVVEFAF